MTLDDDTLATIEEFQRRRQEFKPHWAKAILLGLVGVGVLALGGENLEASLLTVIGLGVVILAVARAVYLIQHYQRCPVCESFVSTDLQFSFLECGSCGARLSKGLKDQF